MKSIDDDGELVKVLEVAWDKYRGDTTVLASAMGALVIGRLVGWQGLRVMYSGVTFRKYEKILGLKFREVLPARGPEAHRLNGIQMADRIGKFWQAVSSGLVPAREAAVIG